MAVDRVKILLDVELDDGGIFAPLHTGDPHVMLHVERGTDGALPVLTRKRTIDEHGPEDALQLLMDGELDDLVSELWDVKAPRLRLRDRLMPIWARPIFFLTLGGVWPRPNGLEPPP